MRSISDIKKFEEIPWRDRCLGESTYDLFSRSARLFADRPAMMFQFTSELDEEPTVVSYRVLLANINRAANAFYSAGVGVGSVVSVLLPNLPQYHSALWGSQALGICGTVNPMLEPGSLRDILSESGAEALVVLGPTPGYDIWEKTCQIVDDVESLKVIFQVRLTQATTEDGSAGKSGQTPGGKTVLDFNTELARSNSGDLDFDRTIQPHETAAYFHTGGTSGTPKIAELSQQNQVFVASVFGSVFNFNDQTVAICGLPLFHVNAIFHTGLNVFAYGGVSVCLTPSGYRYPGVVEKLWQFIEKYRATFFSAVPTIISSLLRATPSDRSLIRSLKYVFCGAAPMSTDTLRNFVDRTGVPIIEGYGMTEGSCISSFNPEHGEKKVGSVGLRLPYQAMKCVELDAVGNHVRDCCVNEVGVIVIKGPNVIRGYKRLEDNRRLFLEDGWLVTGDLGRQDEDGYFWVTGRAKELIIRGGHNIDPRCIEEVLSDHPAVDLVVAVGQPDAHAGELPCAYVTTKKRCTANIAELMEYAAQNIAERMAVPVHIEIIEEMPLTEVGKISKPTLLRRATGRVLKNELSAAGLDASVAVVSDEVNGMKAIVTGMSDVPAVSSVLGQFAVCYEIRADSPSSA